MRHRWIFGAMLALGAVACAEALGMTDDYPAKLAKGCQSELECRRLLAEADGRLAKCKDNTVGYIRCGDAKADRVTAAEFVKEYDREKVAAANDAAEQREEQRQADEMAEERARDRRAAEKQRKADEEQAERVKADDEARWAKIDLEACSIDGDPGECSLLRIFISASGAGPHGEEAKAALAAGGDVMKARDAAGKPLPPVKVYGCCDGSHTNCAYRSPSRCCSRSGGVCREPEKPSPPVARQSSAPAQQESSGNVCCCDGSVSPTCTTNHRGCCSRHGGVCACN